MQVIPSALQARFEEHLRTEAISDHLQWSYKKWLRYYLDYCETYHYSPKDKSSLPRFIGKLRDKKQTEQQQGQAAEAIKMYYDVLGQDDLPLKAPQPQPIHHQENVPHKDDKHVFIRKSPATAEQSQRIALSLSRGSSPSSEAYSSSRRVIVSGTPPRCATTYE